MKYYWDTRAHSYERKSDIGLSWYSFVHKKWFNYLTTGKHATQVPDLALILQRVEL